MSSLDEWRPSYNDDHKFLVHQLPPLFNFFFFRREKNKLFWRFLFCELRIYDDLMSEVRFSDLEMGLSLFDDRVVLEATYVSIPYKA